MELAQKQFSKWSDRNIIRDDQLKISYLYTTEFNKLYKRILCKNKENLLYDNEFIKKSRKFSTQINDITENYKLDVDIYLLLLSYKNILSEYNYPHYIKTLSSKEERMVGGEFKYSFKG